MAQANQTRQASAARQAGQRQAEDEGEETGPEGRSPQTETEGEEMKRQTRRLMALAALTALAGMLLCGCAGPMAIPTAPAMVEVSEGVMTVTPAVVTFLPVAVIVKSGKDEGRYIPVESLGIPWIDIIGIAIITLIGAAVVFVWLKSKNGAAIILALGGAGIGGIVFWEIKWFILGAAAVAIAAWIFLPRLKETLSGGDD